MEYVYSLWKKLNEEKLINIVIIKFHKAKIAEKVCSGPRWAGFKPWPYHLLYSNLHLVPQTLHIYNNLIYKIGLQILLYFHENYVS